MSMIPDPSVIFSERISHVLLYQERRQSAEHPTLATTPITTTRPRNPLKKQRTFLITRVWRPPGHWKILLHRQRRPVHHGPANHRISSVTTYPFNVFGGAWRGKRRRTWNSCPLGATPSLATMCGWGANAWSCRGKNWRQGYGGSFSVVVKDVGLQCRRRKPGALSQKAL